MSVLLVVASASMGAVAVDDGAAHDVECEFPLTITDATGEELTIEEPPERIVTTAPSAAQVLWEIGGEHRVVAVTTHALYLDGADERDTVSGEDGSLDVELVIEQEADLVLAPNVTGVETVEQLRDADQTVYHFPAATSLDDVFTKTELIGQLSDECEGASETLTWMDEERSLVQEAAEQQDASPSVIYLFFDFTTGSGTHIHDIIVTAGATNVAADVGLEQYQPINAETIIDADPDWILVNDKDPALPESEAFNETPAVQENRFIEVDVNHINQPGPWNIHALTTIAAALYPEAYDEVTAEADDEATAHDDTDDTVADPDDPLVGFGIVAAILAIVGGLTLRRRG